MNTPPVHTVNLCTVLSETKRLVKANYGHFFALYLLLLPLSFSLVIAPSLHLHLSSHFFTVDLFHKLYHQTLVVFHLLYILIVYLLTLCAICTISYNTYNVSIGKPANYFTALRSLAFSLFPLVSTAIVTHLLLILISLPILLFIGVIEKNLGLVIDYNSIYFSIAVGSILIAIAIYFHMNFCLALMVVVAESKWGFAALIRSWYLTKGMRSVSLSLLLYFSICNGSMAWLFSQGVSFSAWSGETFRFVLLTIFCSFFLMLSLVMSIAANSVFYVYCKVFHGELAVETAEGLYYVKLPSGDTVEEA